MTRYTIGLLAVLVTAPAAASDRPAKTGKSAVHCTQAPAATGTRLRKRVCSPTGKQAARPAEQQRVGEIKAPAKK